LRYAAVALCAQGFNLAVFLGIRLLAPTLPPLGALGVSAILATGFSFTGQTLVTFQGSWSATSMRHSFGPEHLPVDLDRSDQEYPRSPKIRSMSVQT
jgi:putative flippase GtrA